jgi:AmmeMemoRadiSam system protein A
MLKLPKIAFLLKNKHREVTMDQKITLIIARNAIKSRFEQKPLDKKSILNHYPELRAQGASFITLTLHGRLRGCIGSIIAHRPLIDDLIANAQSAAFDDPRFPPLSFNELDQTRVEVSLLTHPEAVTYLDADALSHIIRPNVDGVILRLGDYQATFLPQVWEELSDFKSFFDHLGLKAGIGTDPLSHHPEIYIYQVEKYKEHSND